MPDERRGAQRREADVLPEPRAQRQHDFLTRPVPLAERVRYRIAAQVADQLDRAREQLRLPLHVVAIHPAAESRQQRGRPRGPQVLGEIQLAALTDPDVEKRVPHEVDGGALDAVREARRRHEQHGARPPVPRLDETVDEMEVEVHEAEIVADAVEQAAEPRRGAAQPRQLTVGRVEDVGDDEQPEADQVGPAIAVREQVAGHEPDRERPQRHLVRGDAGRLERARNPDTDRPEEVEVDPLLDGSALIRQVVRRLHPAHPSWSPGRPAPDLRR